MPKSRRDRLHEATRQEIIALAWKQIAASGAANLSLRKIAIAMGLTPPALYRYFAGRDELVTELILDAYDSFAAALEQYVRNSSGTNAREMLLRVATGYRDWAISFPQRYSMIFGTPIPGYHAPEEITLPAARKSLVGLIHTIAGAFSERNRYRANPDSNLPPDLDDRLTGLLHEIQLDMPSGIPYLALVTWAKVHGLVSLEIYGHWDPLIGDAESFYLHTMQAFIDQVVLSNWQDE